MVYKETQKNHITNFLSILEIGSEVACHEVLRQQPCGDVVLRSRNRAFSWG